MGVPTLYTRLLQEQELDHEVTQHVRLFISGSAPLLPETYREFFDRTGQRILERYGMTETLMNTSNPYEGPAHPRLGWHCAAGCRDTRGRSRSRPREHRARTDRLPGGPRTQRIRRVLARRGEDPGRIHCRWMVRTGDLGKIDRDGYVYIVGRVKDLVITGGYNVYPKEVETELDAIDGVLESAVFGVPHPDFGEGVTAAVVSAPGVILEEAAIIAAVRNRLAAYKVPKRVVLVEALPRNTMGKVQKNVLRSAYATLYRIP